MPSITVENYVKQIYLEQQRTLDHLVSMGRLAEAMRVTPGTATSMIKALADSGLVKYVRRSGVRLSKGGEQLALHVLRRHRLLELFLVQVVGLDWSEVHSEAEELEHAVSDKLLARMDALLGHPSADPHGDPIPPSRGRLPAEKLYDLLRAPGGRTLKVARIMDQDPASPTFGTRIPRDGTIRQDFILGYQDECSLIELTYRRDRTQDQGLEPDNAFLVRFTLRSLVD